MIFTTHIPSQTVPTHGTPQNLFTVQDGPVRIHSYWMRVFSSGSGSITVPGLFSNQDVSTWGVGVPILHNSSPAPDNYSDAVNNVVDYGNGVIQWQNNDTSGGALADVDFTINWEPLSPGAWLF